MKRPTTLAGRLLLWGLLAFVAAFLITILLALVASEDSSGEVTTGEYYEGCLEIKNPETGQQLYSPEECWSTAAARAEETREPAPETLVAAAPTDPAAAESLARAIEPELIEEEEPLGATASARRKNQRPVRNRLLRRRPGVRHHLKGGVTCYRGRVSRLKWKLLGNTVGELKVRQFGWCGDERGRIVKDFGWGRSSGAWGPYCITNEDWERGWYRFPGSKYGRFHASLGVDYPFGCFGVRSGTSIIRIFGNGYFDFKDDV